VACGKKTDPVPKSMFSIPIPKEDQIVVQKNGLLINNNSKDYLLYVYKSTDERCVEYKFLTIIAPGKSFFDSDLKIGEKVSYKMMYKHPEYKIYSDSLYITKYFVRKPVVRVKNIKKVNNGVTIFIEKDKDTRFVVYGFDKNSLNNITKKDEIIIRIEKPFTLYLQPISKENIRGDILKVEVDKRYFERLVDVYNVKVIKNGVNYIITWESKANIFKVLDKSSNKVNITHEKFFMSEGCGDYIIFATNGIVDSNGVYVSTCK